MVDDGVAQNAIEPGDGTFRFAQLRTALDGLEIGRLENVLGGGIVDTAAQKLQETAVLPGKAGDCVSGCGRVRSHGEDRRETRRVAALPGFH